MPKIYTKTGDEGMTSLIGGKRVPKGGDQVHAYGTIDELASFIGLLSASLGSSRQEYNILMRIQENLLKIEAYYASEGLDSKYLIDPEELAFVEQEIDCLNLSLPALKTFLIPGNSILSSYAHICRTVCRRAERYASAIDSGSENFKYLNRLSDYFFVLARTLEA